jgi:two-component system, NarL family, sensor histidine kinase UhpB
MLAKLSSISLVWRVIAVNTVVFALGVVALAVSPATVSFPIAVTEALVLAAGLAAILLVNLVLVRRSLVPLQRLMELMRRVDLLRPGERLAVGGPAEVQELGAVFGEMLDRLERERRESASAQLARVEDERKRVAQELHDELGQSLTGVMLTLGRTAARVPEPLSAELIEAQETTRSALDSVRRIARQLRPEALDDLGLVPALTSLVKSFADLSGLEVERSIADRLPGLSDHAELAVFRVAQESLTNVARHAGATRVRLELKGENGRVLLSVRDDGRGLGNAAFGTGIRGMQERAMLVGGALEVFSPRSGGVEIRLTVPGRT